MQVNSTDNREFWKKIGKIGVAAERKSNIPMEVIIDGVVKRDRESVVKKWQDYFSAPLNAGRQQNVNINDHITITNRNVPLVDNGIESPIKYEGITKSIKRAKLEKEKAIGSDDLPTVFMNHSV